MFKLSVLIILKCVSDSHDFVRKKTDVPEIIMARLSGGLSLLNQEGLDR